eukprot:6198485-Pleurochrysis_carterae.AAC.1
MGVMLTIHMKSKFRSQYLCVMIELHARSRSSKFAHQPAYSPILDLHFNCSRIHPCNTSTVLGSRSSITTAQVMHITRRVFVGSNGLAAYSTFVRRDAESKCIPNIRSAQGWPL